jgi:uncharacterized damage-inducible protein DinB
MQLDQEHVLRKRLVALIRGGEAFTSLDKALADIPFEKTGIVPDQLPYSIWQLTEHLRIAQEDIYRFSVDPDYESPEWPGGYWPDTPAPTDPQQWEDTLAAIFRDRERMIERVSDRSHDLYEPFPHGSGQNLLREAMLVAEHNAYHTGQIVLVRRLLDIW